MNKIVTKIALALLAVTCMMGQAEAQIVTTFARNVTPGQQNGLYYSLPQTMLKLDFVIEETKLEKSPLADYAQNYMGNADVVEYETTEYKLLDVKMSTVASPDPSALFFVTFGSARGGGKALFDVMPNGIIRSVGLGNAVGEETAVAPVKEDQPEAPVAKAYSKDVTSLITTGKSNGQLAKEVADKIEEIRKAKFYLISGDVEMASNPETFSMMYQKLEEMEDEYTQLLLGQRKSKTVVKTVYVIPNKETPVQTVARFSEYEGLTVGTAGSGETISVQTMSLNTTEAINAPSQSAIESMNYENKVFYRVPEQALVKVLRGNKPLAEERMTINQLGALLMAPLQNTKLVFDTKTGQITNLIMQ